MRNCQQGALKFYHTLICDIFQVTEKMMRCLSCLHSLAGIKRLYELKALCLVGSDDSTLLSIEIKNRIDMIQRFDKRHKGQRKCEASNNSSLFYFSGNHQRMVSKGFVDSELARVPYKVMGLAKKVSENVEFLSQKLLGMKITGIDPVMEYND